VDDLPRISPATFTWEQYSDHSVEVEETIPAGIGSRWSFAGWSDGEDRAHRLWATRDSRTYTATYALEHYLDLTASAGGSVSPASAWHAAGEPVTVEAVALSGYSFDRWEGTGSASYSGATNPAVVRMDGPVTEQAIFVPNAYEFSVSASDVDPHVNSATPAGTPRYLYLWVTCARGGLSAFEADVHSSMPLFGFEPLNGVLNAGTAEHILLAVPGCPTGEEPDQLVGRWLVYDLAPGGEVCLGGESDPEGQLAIGAVDCGTVSPYCTLSPGVTGFSSRGSPCRTGTAGCGRALVGTDVPAPAAARDLTTLLPGTPNPFAASVQVRFTLGCPGRASIRVYDVAGRLVRSLLDEDLPAGARSLAWDGRDASSKVVPNGVYFLRLETGGVTLARKVVRLEK
jgi:hypothetical protein